MDSSPSSALFFRPNFWQHGRPTVRTNSRLFINRRASSSHLVYLNFRMSDSAFDSMRLWLCLVLSLLRLLSAPSCFQAYLNLAQNKMESLKKEAGRISNVELKKRVNLQPKVMSEIQKLF